MAGLPERWYPLRRHEDQTRYVKSPHRFNVLPCGRRSGKTERAKRKLVRAAMIGSAFSRPRYFAAAPTRDQAKRIYWQDLKDLVPPGLLAGRPSESELIIRLVNGAEIHVLGMDKPERIEGSPWDGGILDEYGNMKPHAWGEHVRPALSDRKAWCDLIGVPEGRNHYYDTYLAAQAEVLERGRDSEWGWFHWTSATVLPPEEIAAAKRDLDALTFQQEYEASFVSFEGRVYYGFTDENKARLTYDPKAPLLLCMDFNISPGTTVVAQEMELPNKESGTGVVGEVWIPQHSNTELVCRRIALDWGAHEGRVTCYGDPAGGAGGSAKTDGSDWDIVRRELSSVFPGRLHFKVKASSPPGMERARVNAMNTRICAGDGTRRLYVDPSKAPNTVRDLEGVRWLEGANVIDKRSDPMRTHLTDGLGYYVEYEFPTTDRTFRTTEFRLR